MTSVFDVHHKAALLACCTLLACGAALAQPVDNPLQWRQGIETQRATTEKTYAADKVVCYQQFAVNDCLTHARQRFNAAMAESKRQDVVLNDAQRKRLAALQMRKLEERDMPEVLQGAAAQRTQRAADAQVRQERAEAKQREQALTPAAGVAQARTRDYQQKEAQKAREHRLPALNNPDAAAKQSAFEQKQREALAHQAELEKTRKERTKPLSAPLPLLGGAPTRLTTQLAAP